MVHISSSHESYKAEYKYIRDMCQQDRPKGITSPPFQGLEVLEISVQSRRRLNRRWHGENVARQEHIRKEMLCPLGRQDSEDLDCLIVAADTRLLRLTCLLFDSEWFWDSFLDS